jgi:NodT family efflux transporter outer membrane factor (OMF) lipoprotein
MRRRRAALPGAALLLALALGGCSVRRAEKPEVPVRLPETFSSSGEAAVPARWWTVLGDSDLDTLVAEALGGNMNLRGTWDRLDAARASARKEGTARLPSLEASAGLSRSVAKTSTATTTVPAGRTYGTDWSLGLAAGYEIDLWGRVRAGSQAAALEAEAGEHDLRAAAMSLSAEVASCWYRLVELRGQLAVLDRQARTNRDFLETVTLRFKRGGVPAIDVLQQRQTLEAVSGERSQVESLLRVEENRLAVLLGRAPGAYRPPASDKLPELPPLPATGLLAEWVQRRPDIRSALTRLRAADRRVAAAVADRFPRISLSGSASTSSENVEDLFDNWLASIAGNLLAPLFDAGRRRAEVVRTRAVAAERLHDYGEVLLRSLEEVENALVREARGRDYLRSLDAQIELSEQSVARASDGYKRGTVDFTRFLTTVLAHQRLERSRLQAGRELILHRIGLYRSLGGGWEMTPPGKDGQPSAKPTVNSKASPSPAGRDGGDHEG